MGIHCIANILTKVKRSTKTVMGNSSLLLPENSTAKESFSKKELKRKNKERTYPPLT